MDTQKICPLYHDKAKGKWNILFHVFFFMSCIYFSEFVQYLLTIFSFVFRTPNENVLLNRNAVGDVALKKDVNPQICNDLSLITETFVNMDYTSNTLDVFSKGKYYKYL